MLGPAHDQALPAFGIGFTDIVKRPSANAAGVERAEFDAGARSWRRNSSAIIRASPVFMA